MKKIFFLIVLFIFIPQLVDASDYQVVAHFIDARLEIAGGMRVRELIVIEGSASSFSRQINFRSTPGDWDRETVDLARGTIYNGFSLENLRVSAFLVGDEVDFSTLGADDIDFFEEHDLANITSESFTFRETELGRIYNIFRDVNNERVGFFIEYLVSNVIVIHEDVAEVNYIFKNLDIGAENTMIRVLLPFPTDEEGYHLWVHGPARTNLNELINEQEEIMGFLIEVDNLQSDISFRMTMPLSQVMIPLYLNHSNIEALPEIKRIETERVDEFNASVKVVEVIKLVITVIGAAYLIGSFVLIKQKEKSIFIIYLILGGLISLFNYIFDFHILWLYFIVALPITIKIILCVLTRACTKKVSK